MWLDYRVSAIVARTLGSASLCLITIVTLLRAVVKGRTSGMSRELGKGERGACEWWKGWKSLGRYGILGGPHTGATRPLPGEET